MRLLLSVVVVLFFIYRRLPSLLNYQASALMGKSLFDYHHGGDSECLNAAFKCCKWGVIGIARVELCLWANILLEEICCVGLRRKRNFIL